MLLGLAAAVLLTGCAGSIGRGSFDEEVQSRGGGLGSDLPLDALDALEEELGDDVVLRSVNLTAGQGVFEVRVPGSRQNVDSYRFGTSGLYGGEGLSDPTPVPTGGTPLEPTLFRAERIAFDELDDMVDEALEEADLEDGYAQSVSINRSPGERPTITVTVANERETVPVEFSADGEPVPG